MGLEKIKKKRKARKTRKTSEDDGYKFIIYMSKKDFSVKVVEINEKQ